MFKSVFLIILFIILITGCSSHEKVVPSNAKSFEDEDRLALFALYAKSQGDANSTISLFNVLYDKSGKKEYRNEEIITMIQAGQFERALSQIAFYKTSMGKGQFDVLLERLKIAALMELKRYDEAKELSLYLVEQTKEAQDYQQVAAIYMLEKRYTFALKYLQSAYSIEYDEKILDKMAIILYVNLHKKAEAISNLETHILVHGCSQTICLRLASFYSEENNVDGMLRIYLRLYEESSDVKYAQSIIKLYTYKKDTLALMNFLEKSGVNKPLLLQMYINTKNYNKVVELGNELYLKEGNPYYLGQSAIFEYEGAKNKNDKALITSVMKKLENVISKTEDAVYLNYLGYILIEHDIDVKSGIKHVKKALENEKESPYYLDSLAWGYYKQGYCSKALKLMHKVQKHLSYKDEEVTSHINAIKKCIKKGKK